MNPIAPCLDRLCADVAKLTAQIGRRVNVGELGVIERHGHIRLAPPTERSPNGACRVIRAADGWIAANLARDEDRELVPAWVCDEAQSDPWTAIEQTASARSCGDLLAGAELLGLPVARVGEVTQDTCDVPLVALGARAAGKATTRLKVLDLSALWAGPMCGAVFAAMGASVVKVESDSRPDPTRYSMPAFHRNLNGDKTEMRLDLSAASDRGRLREAVLASDVLITSARPRAFAGLGLSPEPIFAERPSLVWVAITGYGWSGAGASRVAFGDDASAAGGLVRWMSDGTPHFLGDALADPVTGLAAAVGALRGVLADGGVLVDAAMARCAAGAAATCGIRKAA